MYDPTSKDSILNHAQLLLGKSLRKLYPDATPIGKGKGVLGQNVELYHFKYTPNSKAQPDFYEAGIELKCTPLKVNADGSMVSKERLVLNIIDYIEEAKATFDTSSFWRKNQLLLLMFHLSKQGVDVLDYIFKIIRLWNFPEIDKKIIQDDWEKLHQKICNGEAHLISEGDTLYLAACSKGSKAGSQMRNQIDRNKPKAQQRAYSLKSKYLNSIILESLLHPEMCDDVYLSDSKKKEIRKIIEKTSSLVNSISEFKHGETFEQFIERKFIPYYNLNIYEIEKLTGVKTSLSPKAVSNSVIHAILGIKTPKIREFENANLQQKSIRLEQNGRLRESMVFSNIDYMGIVKENVWEDSVLYNTLTQRFLFIVFRKDESNDPMMSRLEKVFFWTMPREDLDKAQEFWQDTKKKISAGVYDNFWKLGDHNIFHVRPKARNNDDKMETPQGTMVTKKAYWLNADYIKKIVESSNR